MKRNLNLWFFLAVILTVAASNSGCGGGSATPPPPPPPPPPSISVSLSPAGAQTIDQGQSRQFTATVNGDSSNKGVNWTLTQNGAACSPGCGTLSAASTLSGAATTYTAPAAVNANLAVNVTATSVADSTKSSTDVTTVVPAPVLNNPAQLPAATVGQPYSYTLIEAGGIPPLTLSITSGSLPAGLSLNSSTGVISGTPTTASVMSSFTATVCDSGNPPVCDSQLLDLLVNAAPDFSLSASPSSLMITQGVSGTSIIAIATQGGGLSGAVSLTASGLPNGVTFSFSPVANNSSTLTLTATATAAIGTVTATITGTSGNLTHTTTLSLTVTGSSPIMIAFVQAPPASLATGATAQVSATILNDPANWGVDWAVACGIADCGSFSPTHTASGATTTYMAPTSVPSGGNVTITATASSKPSPSVIQVVNITSEAAGNIPRFVYASDSFTVSTLAVDAFTGQLRARGYISPFLDDVEPVLAGNPMILDRPGNIMYVPTEDPNTFAPEYVAYRIDPKGGSLTPLTGAPFSVRSSPFRSVIDPTGHYLFALEFPTVTTFVVQVFAIDQVTGALAEVPGSPFDVSSCPSITTSSDPMLMHPSGKFLYFITGTGTCGYAVDTASGTLTTIPGSPFPPANEDLVVMDPLGRFIFFGQNTLVGINQVVPGVSVFAIDATGALSLMTGSPFLAPVPVSDNPWSIATDPDGKFLYLSTQFANSIFAYGISSGQLLPYPSAVFTAPFGGEDLFIDPSGSFLYAVPDDGAGSSPYVSVFSLGKLATAPTNIWPLPSVDSFRVKGPTGVIAERQFFLTFVSGAASDAFTPSFSYVTNGADNDVLAYTINANTGSLTTAPGSPYPTGKMPASIATDLADTRAYVADTTDNTLTGYSINTATGTLNGIAGSPFATSKDPTVTAVDPSGNFAYAVDTQAQKIDDFAIDSTGSLSSLTSVCNFAVNVGTAPSSMAIEPAGVTAYVSDAGSNMLRAFKVFPFGGPSAGCLGPSGSLASVATGSSPSSVTVHPSGNFVYVANAGSNDISAFTALGYQDNFSLAAVSGSPFVAGSNPVSLVVDPTGRFLYTANQNSNDVSAYTIDKLTGVLTSVAGSPFLAGTAPASVTADISGQFLYVANKTSNNVSAFSIDSATGALTQLAGSPFLAGSGPSSIVTTGKIGDGPVPPPPPLLPNPPPPLPPGADFTVSVTPAIQDLIWGKSATYTVTLQPVNGFSGNAKVSLNNPPPGITASPINILVGAGGSNAGNLVIKTSEAASSAGLNPLNVLATSGFLNHNGGFDLAVHRLPGQFTPIKLLSPTGAGTQTFACNKRISAQVTPPGSIGAPFTVQFIRDGKAYPVPAVPFSGFLGFSPNCRVGVVVADASPPSSSPLAVYLFNLDFSVGATPIGGMINLTGSTYFWNDFLFSPDDSLLVMLGASGNGQVIDQNNPQPTNGAYVLDMLNHANPGTLTTFYGSGGYGSPVTACVDLLPSAGVAPTNGCTPVVGTLASQHPNRVRVTFVVNPGAPGTVQRDANGNAELFLVPPF